MAVLRHIPRVLVIQETSAQAGREKVQGILEYAHIYGPWHIQLVQGLTGEPRPATDRAWRDFNGIIAGQMMLSFEHRLRAFRRPLVLFDPLDSILHPQDPLSKAVRVMLDTARVGECAAQHLMGCGYPNYAFLGDHLNRDWSILRGERFSAVLNEHHLPCSVFCDDQTELTTPFDFQRVCRWLLSLPKPVGIFAARDLVAYQLINACHEVNLRIPQDVGVLGVDDDQLICTGVQPTLSSIRCDFMRGGFMAAELLDHLMRRKRVDKRIRHYDAVEVVIRASTARENATDALAKRVREFIQVNAGSPLDVPTIARQFRVSRRLVELRFRTAFNCSIHDEIQRVRLERVKKLLISTSLPIQQISEQCGFGSDIHLYRVFKRVHGCTMNAYRTRYFAGL
mgnify:FL=1